MQPSGLSRKASPEAAGALFDRYWQTAWAAAYAVTADRALADDAAQDAIQQAFGALHRFHVTRPFGPWLCLTPKKLLIRVRVVFHDPVRLELDGKRQWVGAIARIDKGQVAVRLPSGKPLAYAEVLDSGSARMFAKGCS